MLARRRLSLSLVLAWACAATRPHPTPSAPPAPAAPPAPPGTPAAPSDKVITVIGTNDAHGHVEHVGVLAGYVARLRELRRADGGVILVDAGDMLQGTLESNLGEGAAMIAAMNALGYTAAALGNHEFDFGPVGEADGADPRGALRARLGEADGADPRGALRARLGEARFPVLAANLVDARTGSIPAWENLQASVLIEVSGVRVGLVGVLTAETPSVVMPAYFAGLEVTPLADALSREARALRRRGARVVVAVAHAGGVCQRFEDPRSDASCNRDEELNRVSRDLEPGTVDVIVGGHTHAGVAHYFSGVPVVEAYSAGRAFSRVDLHVPADPSRPVTSTIFPPRQLCADPQAAVCEPGRYEGAAVVADPRADEAVRSWREAAARRRAERLGVRVTRAVIPEHSVESALGNLYADLLLAATPGADVAVLNGGSLRAPLPAGELTYGQLYESQPFDNRVVRMQLTGAELRASIADHLQRERHGIVSIAGARVVARCRAGRLEVVLTRAGGRTIRDADRLTVATSDYLATGGDELFAGPGRRAPAGKTGDRTVRDALAHELRKWGGTLDGADPRWLDRARPRLTLPAPRPVRCER